MEAQFCDKCGKRAGGGVKLQRCSACKCVHYCGTACRDSDWTIHKKYCKRLIHVKKTELAAYVAATKKADPSGSAAYQAALQAAADDKARSLVLVTPIVSQNFAKACENYVLPSCEVEEKIWGLYGHPSSPGYQRLLTTYQRALKFGDMGAQQLMECLLARPEASKALSKALKKVRFVMCEEDSLETVMRSLDSYAALVDGLEVNSEFDKWPIAQGS